MLKRTISGIIGASLVLMALIFNSSIPMLLNVLFALACTISMYEVFSAVGVSKKYALVIPTYIFTMLIPIFASFVPTVFIWYIYTLVVFIIMMILKDNISLKQILVSYTIALVITFSMTILLNLRNSNDENGIFFVVLTLVIAWMCDTGAYFFGSLFGKHKLCPSISPKKTVEGAIIGIIVSILSSILACFIFEQVSSSQLHINYIYIAAIALVGSIISIIGDLSFSFIKRQFNIKDFGDVIPGHGGLLDRIDSVVLIPPFLFILNTLFPII